MNVCVCVKDRKREREKERKREREKERKRQTEKTDRQTKRQRYMVCSDKHILHIYKL